MSVRAMVSSSPKLWSSMGYVWVHGATTARVCVNVHGSCYHQRLSGYSGSGLPLGEMFECHAAIWTMLIRAICNATRAIVTPRPRLLPRTMFGSMVLLQPESVLSEACVATKGHIDT